MHGSINQMDMEIPNAAQMAIGTMPKPSELRYCAFVLNLVNHQNIVHSFV